MQLSKISLFFLLKISQLIFLPLLCCSCPSLGLSFSSQLTLESFAVFMKSEAGFKAFKSILCSEFFCPSRSRGMHSRPHGPPDCVLKRRMRITDGVWEAVQDLLWPLFSLLLKSQEAKFVEASGQCSLILFFTHPTLILCSPSSSLGFSVFISDLSPTPQL